MTTAAQRLVTLTGLALVLLTAVGTWALGRPQHASARPGPPATSPAPDASTLPGPSSSAGPSLSAGPVRELSLPGGAAKCVPPTAGKLRASADFAFAGTVSSVYRDAVTLRVTEVFRGEQAGAVRVPQQGTRSEGLLGSGTFELGKEYLVAAAGGAILVCGYSGEAGSPGLRELFDTAF
ncbi:hypothetical protein [Actinoplanes sp. URMC 104]|uniref:hypothetical protein n=1 Tax=Actinoplanes sp. URMC 104 TaxID=3423409 RepID=UPI003F197379